LSANGKERIDEQFLIWHSMLTINVNERDKGDTVTVQKIKEFQCMKAVYHRRNGMTVLY